MNNNKELSLSKTKVLEIYKKHFLVLLCIKLVVFGLILRLMIQGSSLSGIDENNSLSLLIGKDFLDGRFSAFRYGHNFGGTLENLVTAPLVAIFGMTDLVVKIVPLVYLIGTSVLLWKGFERTPYRDKMRIAMAVLWIWPGYFVYSSSNISGYLSVLLLLYAGLLFSSFYAAHSLVNRKYYFLFAFLSGLALWVYPLSIVFTLVCLAWIRRSSPALKLHNLRALSIFIFGSLLWWAKLLGSSGESLIRTFEKNVGPTTNGFSNNGESLLSFLDIKTISTGAFVFRELNIVFAILYLLAMAGVIAATFFGARKALKTQRTDFAFLSATLLISQLILSTVFWIFSVELGPAFYIGLVIPLCFTALFAMNSKIVLGIGISAMFFVSLFSLIASTKVVESKNDNQVLKIEQKLQSRNISSALATHSLSYPISVASDNEMTISPFDFNAFDQKRATKVQSSIQAIVVEQDHKDQTDVALCVQGAFGQAFERTSIAKTDIYFVPKDLRIKAWEVTKLCLERP